MVPGSLGGAVGSGGVAGPPVIGAAGAAGVGVVPFGVFIVCASF